MLNVLHYSGVFALSTYTWSQTFHFFPSHYTVYTLSIHPHWLKECTLILICLACLNCAGDEWYLFCSGPWGSHILAAINNVDGMPWPQRCLYLLLHLWMGVGSCGLRVSVCFPVRTSNPIRTLVWYLDLPLARGSYGVRKSERAR